jgi:hypothetical protein
VGAATNGPKQVWPTLNDVSIYLVWMADDRMRRRQWHSITSQLAGTG